MWLVIGLMLLFIISSVSQMVFGYNIEVLEEDTLIANYDSYDISEITQYKQHICKEYYEHDNFDMEEIINPTVSPQSSDGPMESPWPMYCHDVRHTGRSPYSTADNPGTEKWRFDTIDEVSGSPVIDIEGNIYIGSRALYAIYPNGTLKWKYITNYHIESAPTIDENGVIYFGTVYGNPYLFAIYSNNGTLKWKYFVGDSIFSSPAIGADGSIYFGSESDYIYALYPNGTLKWKYLTGVAVYSSPAIGDDGTIYCGSHDGNLYALYPNNGTLKWKYQTGSWVARGPSIADDDTIYFGSWDGYLYAVYPDGNLKWKTGVNLAGTTPVTAQDGTIYVGNRYLSAIYPSNGSVKWTFDPGSGRTIRGSNPCISAEGIIYFGTHIGETDGGELIAVNPDGTERWRIMLATTWIWSAPAIGSDGTVYVGSSNDVPPSLSWGYLHAIGKRSPNAPNKPTINGPRKGKINTNYTYTAITTDADGDNVSYYFDWGDGTNSGWTNYVPSGTSVSLVHSWQKNGFYIIKVKAKDDFGKESDWGRLIVKMPKYKLVNFNSLLLKLVEQFPFLERLSYIFS